MSQQISNDGRSRLIGAITDVATSLTVEAATADLFPIANTTDWLAKVNWFKAVLEDNLARKEIIHVGVRNAGSGIFSNVLRGQEGTTPLAYAAGSIVRVSITAGDIQDALTGTFDTVSAGALNVAGAATIAGKFTHNGVESRPTPVGGIIMYSGLIAAIPAGWQLCNGTNGTPDLRDKFVIGAMQDDAGLTKTTITGALTQSGGSKDAVLPSHTHAATVGVQSADHTHSGVTTTDGAHNHSAAIDVGGTFTAAGATGAGGGVTSTNGNHSHAFTTGGMSVNHTHVVTNASTGVSPTNANLPPYFALAFICCMAYP